MNMSAMPSRQQPALEALTAIDATTIAGILELDAGRGSGLYGRLVALYEQSAARNLTELETALANQDFAAGADICHKFKSASANVGAVAFGNALRNLEALCRTGDLTGAKSLVALAVEALPALLDNLRSQGRQAGA